MSLKLFTCHGGHVVLPDPRLVLVSREDGGNLIVIPPREVWERSELSPPELTYWSFLVAATGKAMLDVLPQLEGGCINYWEAGNWALNEQADPKGSKTARKYRKVHMHLLGRSRLALDSPWRWGEAPKFPDFEDRYVWASGFDRLRPEECRNIVEQVDARLKTFYGMHASHISPWSTCQECEYPTPVEHAEMRTMCEGCRGTS